MFLKLLVLDMRLGRGHWKWQSLENRMQKFDLQWKGKSFNSIQKPGIMANKISNKCSSENNGLPTNDVKLEWKLKGGFILCCTHMKIFKEWLGKYQSVPEGTRNKNT